MAVVVVFILLAVFVSLAFVLGGVLLPLFLVLGGLVLVVWVGMLITRRTPAEVVRRTERREFLGPGGPDDPAT